MDGVEILAQARAAGIHVKAHGETLAISGPSHAAPLAQQLIERKADIIPLLRAEGTESLPDADTTPTALMQATAWLATALAHGPQPEGKLALEAQAAGITEATLRRAKSALGVQSKRQGKHCVWVSPQGAQDAQCQDAQSAQCQDAHGQGVQDAHGQGAQPQQANPTTITGADGRSYTVALARCRRCSGSNWGPSGRHTPDGAEIWSCLGCARPSPETPPAPCASDRDEYACPACGPYTIVRDARGVVCYRCHQRF
jgi:hypothetical protein